MKQHLLPLSLLLVSFVLYLPILRRPLSEDDGNWYYLATFWGRGVRLYKNIVQIYGYFGIHWLAAILYNGFRANSPSFFNYFKVAAYILNALSVYALSYVLWESPWMAGLAAYFFVLVTSIPNTLFFLTYGEHFFILPINLSVAFAWLAIQTGEPLLYLMAGLLSGWAVQIKPTVLIFGGVLAGLLFFAPNPGLAIFLYAVPFLGINLLPFIILWRTGGDAIANYFLLTFGPAMGLIKMILTRMGIHSDAIRLFKVVPPKYFAYLKNQHQASFQLQQQGIRKFLLPCLKDLRLLVVLFIGQVVSLLFHFDGATLLLLLLLIIFLAMQQIQKNYYTPHFNPCWVPISLLAAKTMVDIAPKLIDSPVLGLVFMTIIAIETWRIGNKLASSFKKENRDTMAYLGATLGSLFRLAEKIGYEIRKRSRLDDKLLIWGDQPSIYLYAQREAFDTDYLFLYSHYGRILDQEELNKLLASIRSAAPEYILFFNYKFNDGWTMERLEEAVGVPYRCIASFRVKDPAGKVIRTSSGVELDFPLYRREDERYKDIIIDRALAAKALNHLDAAIGHLEKAREIYPQDEEIRLRLSQLKGSDLSNHGNGGDGTSQSPDSVHSTQSAIHLQMFAEEDIDNGRWESALKRCLEARSFNPQLFRIYNSMGEACLHIGKAEQAFTFFQKALELNPFSADAYNNLGVILASREKREEAAACFRRSLSIIPEHPDTVNNMEILKITI